ncbi:hypothetical protein EYF80_055365 [Liparis tanakae]|uniref:Uncharacterized protein n=1 Tax=Liparis tanakae TaxID=230148 RepID=A0A4Z2F129_9TELE|nr:hypothetical protein EYF80_055365 [Liparis tanakae]
MDSRQKMISARMRRWSSSWRTPRINFHTPRPAPTMVLEGRGGAGQSAAAANGKGEQRAEQASLHVDVSICRGLSRRSAVEPSVLVVCASGPSPLRPSSQDIPERYLGG